MQNNAIKIQQCYRTYVLKKMLKTIEGFDLDNNNKLNFNNYKKIYINNLILYMYNQPFFAVDYLMRI